MAPPLVTGFGVIAIYVTDLFRARAFYVDALGLRVEGERDARVLLRAGDVRVYLESSRPRPALPDADNERATVVPCFLADGVLDAERRLREAGFVVVQPTVVHADDFAALRVSDPDGNVVELAGTP